jgi:hypothetical protein
MVLYRDSPSWDYRHAPLRSSIVLHAYVIEDVEKEKNRDNCLSVDRNRASLPEKQQKMHIFYSGSNRMLGKK